MTELSHPGPAEVVVQNPDHHHHHALTVVYGLGRASGCVGYASTHRPRPIRYVWHHVLPQACGGKTAKDNLASLCDNCHYAVHSMMWLLAHHNGQTETIIGWSRLGTAPQRELAMRGYQGAVAAGTVNKIPNEGGEVA